MKQFLFKVILFSLITLNLSAQENPDSGSVKEINKWEFDNSIYYYAFPQYNDVLTLISCADYKSIHIEARYNYEDTKAISVFGGYRFEFGEKITWALTPIAGIVLNNTDDGFAPGLLMEIGYKDFDFYSESEYVFNFELSEYNYFYTWSELGWSGIEKIRVGLSANRTRLFQTERELQRGIFGEYTMGNFTAGLHYFNPVSDDYFFIATLNFTF
jgi:hypothetical protein